jgi:hypothetical protein
MSEVLRTNAKSGCGTKPVKCVTMVAMIASELQTSHGPPTVAFLWAQVNRTGPSWRECYAGGGSAKVR